MIIKNLEESESMKHKYNYVLSCHLEATTDNMFLHFPGVFFFVFLPHPVADIFSFNREVIGTGYNVS